MLLAFTGALKASAQEAYAVLSINDTKLTFYYDTEKLAHQSEGTLYSLDTILYPEWNGKNKSITWVSFSSSFANFRPTNCSFWFEGMSNLVYITGIENFKTENVTNMQYMFNNVSELTSLDLSGFNTANVTKMTGMFCGCTGLTSLDLSSFNTANVTRMAYMFEGCSSLKNLNVSGFNTANVTDMTKMFYDCDGLTFLNLSGFTFNSNTETTEMLSGCSNLKSLSIPASANYLSDDACTHVGVTYSPCHLYYPNGFTPDVTSSGSGYYQWKTGYFKDGEAKPYAVLTNNNTTLTFYYDKNLSIQSNTAYELNTGSDDPGWHGLSSSITQVVFDPAFVNARPTSCKYWFSGMHNLTSITGLGYLNTENVTNMVDMFASCYQLTSLDLSGFTFNSNTNTYDLLYNCSGLKTLTIPYITDDLNSHAFTGVGTASAPCTLIYPIDQSIDDYVTAGSGYIQWCDGYFKENSKPYAVLTNNNTKLTFYYDTSWRSRSSSGTVCLLNIGSRTPGWYDNRTTITSVDFNTSFKNARPPSCYYWFGGMTNLTSITGIAYLKTDNVTNMKGMFSGCSRLTSLNLTWFKTDNVTDMNSMFYNCSGVTSLDVSGFNTAKVTDMFNMFGNCSGLTSLDVSSFNTAKVTSMQQMFYHCSGLTSLDLSSFNTANVTTMQSMFTGCNGLTSLNVSSFTTPKVTSMMDMFNSCSSVKRLDLSGFTFKSNTETLRMLGGCRGLQTLNIPATANYLNANACSGVGTETTPCSLVYPAGTTLDKDDQGSYFIWKRGYFKDAEPEAYAVLSPDETTLTFYYDMNSANRPGTVYDLNTESNNPEWYDIRTSITGVVFDSSFANARPTSCYRWFYGMTSLTSITDIGNLNTSSVTNMSGMFYACSGLTSLDVSGFNTEKVTNMGSMFNSCSKLTSLDVSGFNTEEVTNMGDMFYHCKKLTSLDVSGFNTEKVTRMAQLFDHCESLTSLDLSHFTFKSGTTNYLLQECKSLKTLIIPSTATYFYSNACTGVGTTTNPCTLIYPDGFPLSVTSSGTGWYQWKSGYFTDDRPVPYAVLSSDGKTLTFYYDSNRSNYPTTYNLNTGTNDPEWFAYESPVTSVVFDASFADARPTSCYDWFCEMPNLTSITGIGYLNTSEVTNMEGMFAGCTSLTSLDLSGFNTANVTSMDGMFAFCGSLTSLDLSGFTTTNVTDMTNMFVSCSSLTSLDVSGFNTANVTSMYQMFASCSKLTSLHLSGFNTANVTNMEWMFADCYTLTSLDVSGFNTANVTSMYRMFAGCSSLTSLNVSGVNTEKVTNMNEMFQNCSSLTSLDVSSFNTARVRNMDCMFEDCSSLTSLNLSNFTFNHGEEDEGYSTSYLLHNCSALKTLSIPSTAGNLSETACENVGTTAAPCSLVYPESFTPEATSTGTGWYQWNSGYFKDAEPEPYVVLSPDEKTLTFYYDKYQSLCNGTLYELNTGSTNPGWYGKRASITGVVFNSSFANALPTSCYSWFYGMTNLTSITGIGYLNTSSVTNMRGMFGSCSSLTSLDVSGFNTANVTNMNSMFLNCSSLTSLDLSKFNTAKVTDMENMFRECRSLTSLDLSKFNTAKVTIMRYMFYFYNGSSLTSLDVSNFNTAKVTDMSSMFYGCTGLQSLDLSHFTFKSSLTSDNMLKNCSGLQSLAIPISASYLNANACTYVGTDTNPCTLVYPAGMTLNKTEETDTYFIWKSGYFKDAVLPGDANGDGTVSVSDVMMTVDYVLGLEPEGFHFDNANVAGGDNMVTVSDVMGIVDIALGLTINQAPPQARYSGADAIGLSATGSQCTVVLENSEPFTALEFTIVMPENATLGNAAMMTARSNGHQVKTQAVAPGRYNMMVFAPSGMPLRDGTTALLRFDFTGCQPGDIAIEGTQLVNSQYETVLPTSVVTTITGIEMDGDDDGQPYYNTVGIGVKSPTRGVYITNGKKVVVK